MTYTKKITLEAMIVSGEDESWDDFSDRVRGISDTISAALPHDEKSSHALTTAHVTLEERTQFESSLSVR
jgi:hypothetical protein